ncbi:hypothetical protein AFB00_30210 (plasmid) [Pseudonocardia sp. HH130630-07]|nr:hypothetical protein AFB00_30210 [Pseudonocardia sp. HH130630-07]
MPQVLAGLQFFVGGKGQHVFSVLAGHEHDEAELGVPGIGRLVVDAVAARLQIVSPARLSTGASPSSSTIISPSRT